MAGTVQHMGNTPAVDWHVEPLSALPDCPIGEGPDGLIVGRPAVTASFNGPEARLWTGVFTVRLADGLDRDRVIGAVRQLAWVLTVDPSTFPSGGSLTRPNHRGFDAHVAAVVAALDAVVDLSVYHALHPVAPTDDDALDAALLAACERHVEWGLSADWAARDDDAGEAGVA